MESCRGYLVAAVSFVEMVLGSNRLCSVCLVGLVLCLVGLF